MTKKKVKRKPVTKDSRITIRLTDEMRARLEALAVRENRSVANLVETMLLRGIAEAEGSR